MKKMKQLFAVLLALTMVLGMSTAAFADTPTPSPARINGVFVEDPMPTIEAYQIVTYNANGYYEVVPALENYITTEDSTNGDKATIKLTSSDVQSLYYNQLEKVKAGTKKDFVPEKDGETYTGSYTCGDLGLGSWLVVVTSPSGKYVYNPAIISVSQTADGVDYGQLNLNTDTWQGEDGTYLKRDKPTITKTAEAAERAENTQTPDADIAGTQYGDVLKYTITADIPAYTKDRKDITYTITDTIKGLDYLVDETHPVTVTVGGKTTEDTEYGTDVRMVQNKFENQMKNPQVVSEATTDTPAVKKVVVNDLGDAFLTKHSGEKIVIAYYAKVSSQIMINVDRLNNKAELDYSNNNTIENTSGHEDTETKHYTFGIDTSVTGWKESESSNPTGEFVKINDKGEILYTETPGKVAKTEEDVEFLNGAEFQLHIGSSDGPLFTDKSGNNTFTTKGEGENAGRLQIAGLDDGVDYYLVETKAPTGYTLNDTPIKVRIKATYTVDSKTNLKDVLKSYEVIIGDGTQQKITHYNYDIKTGDTEFINTQDTPSNPFGFKNTTLSNLPSTGGIGTTIFTIGGCIIMIAAAGLFFASRRKAAK